MVTKQAHLVPKFYLEGFTGDSPKGQVWTYDKKTGKSWSKVPDETGTQQYFYAVKREDGSIDNTIEDYFADVEGKAKVGHESLLNGVMPTGQVRADYATFIATQFHRTSFMRQQYAGAHAKKLNDQIIRFASDVDKFQEFMHKRGTEHGEKFDATKREEIRKGILDTRNFKMVVPQEITLSALIPADNLMEAIYEMEWGVAHVRDGFLLTSDNPIAAHARKELVISSTTKIDDITFDASSKFDFSLSPHKLLVMQWQKLPSSFTLAPNMLNFVNESRQIRSDRFIYSHKNDDKLKQDLQKFDGMKWGVKELVDPLEEKLEVIVDRVRSDK